MCQYFSFTIIFTVSFFLFISILWFFIFSLSFSCQEPAGASRHGAAAVVGAWQLTWMMKKRGLIYNFHYALIKKERVAVTITISLFLALLFCYLIFFWNKSFGFFLFSLRTSVCQQTWSSCGRRSVTAVCSSAPISWTGRRTGSCVWPCRTRTGSPIMWWVGKLQPWLFFILSFESLLRGLCYITCAFSCVLES